MALDRPDFSPRELDRHIIDTHGYLVSESSGYRIVKAHDLSTSPRFIVMRAPDKFQQPTRRVHELSQTGFTYLRVTSWQRTFMWAEETTVGINVL